MLLMAVVMLVCILVLVAVVRAWAWVFLKGSNASKLILSMTACMFFLVMAKCEIDSNRLIGIACCVSAVVQLLFAMVVFNQMCPTKGKDE